MARIVGCDYTISINHVEYKYNRNFNFDVPF